MLIAAVAGCTTTGNLVAPAELSAADRAALADVAPGGAEDAEPCETVQCGYRELVCPDGIVVQCQEQCRDGLCAPCEVTCASHTASRAAAVDLCARIACPTRAACPDGSTVACPSACDPRNGICSACVPQCPVPASAQAPVPASPPASAPVPAPSPQPSPIPSPEPPASSSARISAISFAVPGEKDDPNLEWVEISGSGDLAGWTLTDEGEKNRYTFPAFTLASTVRIHTGKGTNSASALYWGRTISVWNNGGDTATLKDASGATVAERSGP